MVRINKSAQRVGTLIFSHGVRNEIWYGTNANLGTDILWQRVTYLDNSVRVSRLTGQNIQDFVQQLDDELNNVATTKFEDVNDTLLDMLRKYLEAK